MYSSLHSFRRQEVLFMIDVNELELNSWSYNWVIIGVLTVLLTVLLGVVCLRNKVRTVLFCKILFLSVKLLLVHFHNVILNMAKKVSRRLTSFLVRCLRRDNNAKVIPGANAHRPIMKKPQAQFQTQFEYATGYPGLTANTNKIN